MRAHLVAALVLALAVSTSAFYTDHIVEQAIADVQAQMLSNQLQIQSIKSSRKDMDVTEECKMCVKGSAHWVMDHVIEHLKKVCAETECPMVKKMCEKAAAHPKVTLGWLIGKVRPMALGYAWCNGKGYCSMHADAEDVNDEVMIGDLLSGLHHKSCVETGTRLAEMDMDEDEELEEDEASFLKIFNGVEDDVDEELDEEVEEEGANSCGGCIHGVAKHVMWHTIGKIKKFCKETDKPYIKKMCAAAKEHPHVAFGFLVYKIRPGEWACGFCFGNGACGKESQPDLFHDEIAFDLLDEQRLSLANAEEEAGLFF